MTRFSNFTDAELDSMEDAFLHCEICPYANEGLNGLVDEIRIEMRRRKDAEGRNKLCTQRCCLKNHNSGTIKCDEECNNRTTF